jgi:hypothetical protein
MDPTAQLVLGELRFEFLLRFRLLAQVLRFIGKHLGKKLEPLPFFPNLGNRRSGPLGFNYARDFTLPGQQDGPIGFLMYPYAETTQGHKDSLDPDTFSYRITSQEVA